MRVLRATSPPCVLAASFGHPSKSTPGALFRLCAVLDSVVPLLQERIKEIKKEGGQIPKPKFQSLQMLKEIEGDTDEDLANVVESGHITV